MSVAPKFSTTKPTLFWNKICPFVHRAWIVAIEKNVDIEYQYIPLGAGKPEWYGKEVNPAATVPCLMLPDGKVIRESTFVAQYFDENYGIKGSLQSGSSLQKFKIRSFIKACGEGVIGNMYGLLMGNGEAAEKIKGIEEGLARLEKLYVEASAEGPYFLGANFTMADVTILPFLDRFRYTLKTYRGYNILDTAKYPRLTKMLATAEARPSFALTAQPADFYINGYKGYAKQDPDPKKFQGTLYVAEGDSCPFCQRVKLANALKGSPLETAYLPWTAEGTPDWSKSKIPNYKGESLPVLVTADGTILEESVELTHYVDEVSTSLEAIGEPHGNTITPTDAVDLYETRFLLSEFNETTGDIWAARSGNAEAGTAVLTKLGHLESYYARQKNNKGPYFQGEKATLADCLLLPFWNSVEVLHEVHLAKLPAAEGKTFAAAYPHIAKSLDAARGAEIFKGILSARDKLLESYNKKE